MSLRELLPRSRRHPASGGVLIIQPLPGIGDMVWHLPHIHNIAAQTAEGSVSILTKPRSQAHRLFAADSSVREVLWLDRNKGRHDGILGILQLAMALRTKRFSQAWVLHGSARYVFACLLAGIPHRIGYGRGWQRYLLNDPIQLPLETQRGHPIDKARLLLKAHGVPVLETTPCLRISNNAIKAMEQRFAHRPQPWYVLGIGSSEADKQWGSKNFAELAIALQRLHAGSYFLLGGEAERAMSGEITQITMSHGALVDSLIAEPIEDIAAFLSLCRGYIGNDTGMLNLTVSVGTAALGLYCGQHRILDYSSLLHAVVSPNIDAGMRGITVASVIAAFNSAGMHRSTPD